MTYPSGRTYPGTYPSSSVLDPDASENAYWVGPIGGLVALPDVYSDVAVGDTRLGGSSASLTGRQWRDTLGYQRTWAWKWSNLLPPHVPYVQALAHGLVKGPLRLVDPWCTNRLPEQTATGGSRARSSSGYAVTAGGLVYRDLGSVSADVTTLPPAPMLRGCQEWQRPSGGTGACYLTGSSTDGTWRCPIVPGEGPLELSTWVAGQAGLTVELAWTEYDADTAGGAAHPYYGPGDGLEDVTLSSSVWQKLTLPVDPDISSASLTPRLTVPDATAPAGSVFHTAWQIAALGAEDLAPGWSGGCLPDPTVFGGFRPGGGTPFVVVDPDAATYKAHQLRDLGLLLTETQEG